MAKMKKIKLKVPVLSQLIFSFKSISWPKGKELLTNLFAVIVISVIIGAYLLGLDSLFGQIRNILLFN